VFSAILRPGQFAAKAGFSEDHGQLNQSPTSKIMASKYIRSELLHQTRGSLLTVRTSLIVNKKKRQIKIFKIFTPFKIQAIFSGFKKTFPVDFIFQKPHYEPQSKCPKAEFF
jgi:hypothetical protein